MPWLAKCTKSHSMNDLKNFDPHLLPHHSQRAGAGQRGGITMPKTITLAALAIGLLALWGGK